MNERGCQPEEREARRRHSKIIIPVHFVWATWQRTPLVTTEREAAIYACIVRQAEKAGCPILAIGGVEDHVHLIAQMSGVITTAELMQRIKGVSSTLACKRLVGEGFFGWQDNYGAFALCGDYLPRAISYVRDQKRRHAANRLWPTLEETDEED